MIYMYDTISIILIRWLKFRVIRSNNFISRGKYYAQYSNIYYIYIILNIKSYYLLLR